MTAALERVLRALGTPVAISWHCVLSTVGGGTSFSMLQTMNEGYKAARMTGMHLSGTRLFYMATLGGARHCR